jgi:hypothetical protein
MQQSNFAMTNIMTSPTNNFRQVLYNVVYIQNKILGCWIDTSTNYVYVSQPGFYRVEAFFCNSNMSSGQYQIWIYSPFYNTGAYNDIRNMYAYRVRQYDFAGSSNTERNPGICAAWTFDFSTLTPDSPTYFSVWIYTQVSGRSTVASPNYRTPYINITRWSNSP